MKITVSKDYLDKYLLSAAVSLLLFFYIYSPRVIYLPINFGYLSILIGFLYFSIGNNITKLIGLFRSKIFLTFLYFYFFCIVYAVIVLIFSDEKDNNVFLITYIRLLIDIVFVIPFFVIILKDELNYTIEDFLKKLLLIGVVQGVIATLMIVIPPLKDFTFAYIFDIPSDKLLNQAYRGFGISSDFYLTTPLFQAVVFAINTKFYLEKGKKYLLYYPFILISMVLNARTSIVIIPILFIVIFIMSFYYNEFRYIRKLSSLFISFVGLIILLGFYFVLNPDKLQTVIWLLQGIMGAVGALTGTGQSATLNIIILKQIHFPHHTWQVIFGEGLIVFGNINSPVESDLGYIRYIYYGGLMLSALFYFNIYNFARSCIALTSDNFLKILLISTTALIFITQFKGDVFNSSAFMKGVFLIQTFMLYKRSDSVKG
ncbi:hypothetical protein FFF34_003505 [Inquilinus sp. KBS0705]|nr:hypothetical protein FFF34_003505 [Inquilinus sp. KBS0705]